MEDKDEAIYVDITTVGPVAENIINMAYQNGYKVHTARHIEANYDQVVAPRKDVQYKYVVTDLQYSRTFSGTEKLPSILVRE